MKFEIELKNVKFYERLSQETNCFVADIFVNGEKSFYAKNDGHGGNTNIREYVNCKYSYNEIDEYFKSLPKIKSVEFNFEYNQSFETVVDNLFENWLMKTQIEKMEKDIILKSKNNIVYKEKNDNLGTYRLYTWNLRGKKITDIVELLKNPTFNKLCYDKINELKNNGCTILNKNIPNI